MSEDFLTFSEDSLSTTRSEAGSSTADSTCSDNEKNAIRRRLMELDQTIKQLEYARNNAKKDSEKSKDQLYTLMDRLQNYQEIERKYQMISDCVETPMLHLEKIITDTEEMVEFGYKMLQKLQAVNENKRMRENKLTIGYSETPQEYAKTYGANLEGKFKRPTRNELLEDIEASALNEPETNGELKGLLDELRKEKSEYLQMINESIKYHDEMHQRLSRQNTCLISQPPDENPEESNQEEQECITIPDTQFIP